MVFDFDYTSGVMGKLAGEPVAFAQSSVVAAPTQTHIYTPEEIDGFRRAIPGLPEGIQTKLLADIREQGISDPQQIAGLIDRVLQEQAAAPSNTSPPAVAVTNAVGDHAMINNPTGLEMADRLGVAQQQMQAGYDSHRPEDVERAVARAKLVASNMLANGAPLEETQAAVARIAGPAMASFAIEAAQDVYDQQKFSLSAGAASDPSPNVSAGLTLAAATVESANPQHPLIQAAMVNGQTQQFLAEQEARNRFQPLVGGGGPVAAVAEVVPPMPAASTVPSPFKNLGTLPSLNLSWAEMGPTTAALASNEFRPLDTPNLAPSRGRDTGFQIG